MASQAHAQVSVFLNGEFWFDSFACEKYNPSYFYDHKGIAENNIIIVKDGLIQDGEPEDEASYQAIYTYLGEHDLGNPEYYEEFCSFIDVQSYVDYVCATIYCCNLDQDEITNRVLYRARLPLGEGENDGRWRWAHYDMDVLDKIIVSPGDYDVEEAYQINSFTTRIVEGSPTIMEQTLFKALMQSADFRDRMVTTLQDMMETDYAMENVDRVLKEYEGDTEPLREFFAHRAEYMTQYLNEVFGLD